VFATYLTLPIQFVLYPMAGMAALGAGYFIFHWRMAAGAGFDSSMSWAWTCALLVLLPAIRVETGMEDKVPAYRNVRHFWRVLIFSGWFYYFGVHYQTDTTPQLAALEALILAVPIHFVLRSQILRGIWEHFQTVSWLRKV
jgi:hypothetical protein